MLEYRNVTVETRKGKILNDVSLTLEDGTILGLFGMDERAKSALLQVTAGSAANHRGDIMLDGEILGMGYGYKKAADVIGYMPVSYGFQSFLTVEENFELTLGLHGVNGRYRGRRIDEVLSLMQVDEYKTVFIEDLPSEIYPFVYLGQIILTGPQWLMLDEPFGNLNIAGRNQMANILLKLHEMGMSMIINTQNSIDMTMLFTDVAILENAKLVMSGPIDEVLERATMESTIRMHVLDGLEQALAVLKENDLVERVIVDKDYVAFRFFGQEQDEARLLTTLIQSGVMLQNYTRDPIDLEWYFRR